MRSLVQTLRDAYRPLQRWRDDALVSKQKYVWRIGVICFGLLWGLPMAIIVLVANGPGSWQKGIATFICIAFIAGPVAGWLWGQFMWGLKSWCESLANREQVEDLKDRIEHLERELRQRATDS